MMFSVLSILPLLATHVTYFPLYCDCGIVRLLVVVAVLSSFCTVEDSDKSLLSCSSPDRQVITGLGFPVAEQETTVFFSFGLLGSCNVIPDKPADT